MPQIQLPVFPASSTAKYMRQHYGLDLLVGQGTSPLPDTTRLVNPAWRALDSQVRSATGKLTRQRAAFAARILAPVENNPTAATRHETRKGETLAQLQQQQSGLKDLRTKRRATAHHIEIKDLPPEQRIS